MTVHTPFPKGHMGLLPSLASSLYIYHHKLFTFQSSSKKMLGQTNPCLIDWCLMPCLAVFQLSVKSKLDRNVY